MPVLKGILADLWHLPGLLNQYKFINRINLNDGGFETLAYLYPDLMFNAYIFTLII